MCACERHRMTEEFKDTSDVNNRNKFKKERERKKNDLPKPTFHILSNIKFLDNKHAPLI